MLYKISPDYRLFPQEKQVYFKTGTLKGVYNLAGYIPYQGKNYPFCILINAPKNNRLQVLKVLKNCLIENFCIKFLTFIVTFRLVLWAAMNFL